MQGLSMCVTRKHWDQCVLAAMGEWLMTTESVTKEQRLQRDTLSRLNHCSHNDKFYTHDVD